MIKISNDKKISFYTFGCRLNQAETAVIRNSFKDNPYKFVDIEKPADIVVINTCTVTENGDTDTRRLVSKISRLNPHVKIALVGCQAQVQKEKLTDLPNVFWVVGNAKKFDLAAIIRETEEKAAPRVITPTIDRDPFTLPAAGIDTTHTRANLKIQDGCDFFCSFCEIPYARGRARSRTFENILEEARILAEAGHQEIVLTGINIGTYKHENNGLMDVIDALENIEKIKRIRISSIEPTTIPLALLERMASSKKLCRYLHIPLQSGDDRILGRMQRKYSVSEFVKFTEWAANTVPGICLGTDIIVGFPGEREKEFEATCEIFRQSPLHYCHVFSYSKRHLAKSRNFSDEVPAAVIHERSGILRNLSQRKRRLFFESQLNTVHDVLFEQKKNGLWWGLTDNYIRVAAESKSDLSNRFQKVRLFNLSTAYMLGKTAL